MRTGSLGAALVGDRDTRLVSGSPTEPRDICPGERFYADLVIMNAGSRAADVTLLLGVLNRATGGLNVVDYDSASLIAGDTTAIGHHGRFERSLV